MSHVFISLVSLRKILHLTSNDITEYMQFINLIDAVIYEQLDFIWKYMVICKEVSAEYHGATNELRMN